MTADLRREALAGLETAIAALAPQVNSAEEEAALDLIRAGAARFAQQADQPAPGPGNFDTQRLQGLLDLTGPSMAGTLLRHLAEDLQRCRKLVVTGAAEDNWADLREGSHVLISLAGSVGAGTLHDMSLQLNSLADREDADQARALIPSLVAELDALIKLVRATKPPSGNAA